MQKTLDDINIIMDNAKHDAVKRQQMLNKTKNKVFKMHIYSPLGFLQDFDLPPKKEKPTYIELYSKKPPNIAPKIFDDNALETEFNLNNSFENANPENKIGKAKIRGNTKLIILF